MKDLFTIAGTIVVAVTVAILAASSLNSAFAPVTPADLGSTDFNRFEKATSVTSVNVATTTSTLILASNPARRYAVLSNAGTNPVCLSMATSTNTVKPATRCTGLYLAANGGTYIIDADNLYVGPIAGISTSTVAEVAVIEVE